MERRRCCGACESGNFGLQGELKIRFSESRWLRRGSLLDQSCFLFFRLFLAIYWTGWVAAQIVHTAVLGNNPHKFRWLIYYTHWSALLLAAYFVFAFFLCLNVTLLLAEKKPSARTEPMVYWESQELPKSCKLMWVLHETSGTAQLVTVLLYWVLVYDGNGALDIYNIHMHGVGLFLWLLNTVFSNTPTRLLHVYFPFLYTAAYIGFTVLYHFKDGVDRFGNKYIYEGLDYNNKAWLSAVRIAVVMLGVLPLGHLGLSAFSFIWERIAVITGGFNRNDPTMNGTAQLAEMAKRREHSYPPGV